MEKNNIILEIIQIIVTAVVSFWGGCTYTSHKTKIKNIQKGNVIVGNNNEVINGDKKDV